MSRRFSSVERRGQIVEATLALLADTPADRITTRQVAREVGISQPALFRHFRSRDEILEAAVAHTRVQLEKLASGALAREDSPLESVCALVRGLVDHVARNPGMPRLLFYDVATGEDARYHAPLKHLVSMQRALLGELVRRAQGAGAVSRAVDPTRAAGLLVAVLQGAMLQWQLSDRESPLEEIVEPAFDFWLAALRGGEPRARSGDVHTPAGDAADGSPARFIEALDVRPLLSEGRDPLDTILAALERLPATGILKLTAPFRPSPLLSLLSGRGYRASAREEAPGVWRVEAQPPDSPEIVDLRELEAPEPLERILAATARLEAGDVLIARVPRFPRLLLPHLEERGLAWEVHEEADGTALVHVRRPA
jgi:AcrR family transcriptional regulator/uncharacterized protein (DUF2249 family)